MRAIYCDIKGSHWGSGSVPYGPLLKTHRKILTHALHPRVVETDFVPVQERMSKKLAGALLDEPHNFAYHVKR